MSIQRFKTSLKCQGCVDKVTPGLNQLENVFSWKVDLTDPNRLLIVESEEATDRAVITLLESLGYKAERVEV